jgi:hypothetical protein
MKFIHLREMNGREVSPTGGITIGYVVVPDDDGTSVAYVSTSKCSSKDHYCKKIGRLICKGRLENDEFISVDLPNPSRAIDTIIEVIS